MHLSPLDSDDLRCLAAFIANAENPDTVAPRYFQMQKWKLHPVPCAKCASFGQRADINFAAVIASDRVQLTVAHGAGF